MNDYPVPEIQRCPLEQVVLKSKLLDMGDPRSLLGNALSPPNMEDIEIAVYRLKEVLFLFLSQTFRLVP